MGACTMNAQQALVLMEVYIDEQFKYLIVLLHIPNLLWSLAKWPTCYGKMVILLDHGRKFRLYIQTHN